MSAVNVTLTLSQLMVEKNRGVYKVDKLTTSQCANKVWCPMLQIFFVVANT